MSTENNDRRWAHLTAEDIMQDRVITVSHADPVSDVERVLSENRISGAPVVDHAGRVVGVISVRDLLDRYVEDEDARPRRSPGYYHLATHELGDDEDGGYDAYSLPAEAEETASDLMNREVYSVKADATVESIASSMVEHRIHRVLVEDSEGRIVGLISSMGVLAAITA